MENRRYSTPKKKNNDIIFGVHPVLEAIQAGKTIDKVMMQRSRNEASSELIEQLKKHKIYTQHVPNDKLDRITRKNHQGIIAFLSPISYTEIDMLLPTIYEKGETPLILVLDGITDVRNFGAIVRTAECCGVHGIIVPEKGSARIGSDAIKTSAGALFNVPICKAKNLRNTTRFLQTSGLKVAACTEKGTQDIYSHTYNDPIAIVMGDEETGVSNDIIKISDYLVQIPMLGKTGSLNVSVAAGVALYEVVRQRKKQR